MKFLIQFPTLARPDKFNKAFERYVRLSSGKVDLEFNINCDIADNITIQSDMAKYVSSITSKYDYIKTNINFDFSTTKISSINAHIAGKEFDVVLCASDDMIPKVYKWDLRIKEEMEKNFPNLDGCVYFNDGYTSGKLITFSILGKKLYDHFGYIYHPDYKALYCDNEFTEEVKRLGKSKYIDEVIIMHEHYAEKNNSNSGQEDYAAKKTLYFSGRDEFIFNKRKELGFPRERISVD